MMFAFHENVWPIWPSKCFCLYTHFIKMYGAFNLWAIFCLFHTHFMEVYGAFNLLCLLAFFIHFSWKHMACLASTIFVFHFWYTLSKKHLNITICAFKYLWIFYVRGQNRFMSDVCKGEKYPYVHQR